MAKLINIGEISFMFSMHTLQLDLVSFTFNVLF